MPPQKRPRSVNLPLRRVIFWLHLVAGCVAGLVILVMSVTGVLLTYEEQIVHLAEGTYRAPKLDVAAEPLPLGVLVTGAAEGAAAAGEGQRPTSVSIEPDPRAPVRVSFGRGHTLLVQPYTGEVLGAGATGLRETLRTLTAWHRWLGQTDDGRRVGKAITGACNLAFLFLVLTGIYLWVPRVWSRRRLRSVTWFRRGLKPKARDFNWHNVLGLWMALPLVAVVASGVVMSYPWANELVYRIAGEEAPARRGRGGPGRGGPDRGGEEAPSQLGADELAALETALAAARQHTPDWRSITVSVPEAAGEDVSVRVARGGRGRPDLRESLTIDPDSGRVAAVESFSDQSRGRRLRSWMRWIHTGEAGGFLGQTLAGLASLAAVVLVWTGIALSWRRLVRWRSGSPVSSRQADAMTGEPLPRTDGGSP